MAWLWTDEKQLPEAMLAQISDAYMCGTKGRWVKAQLAICHNIRGRSVFVDVRHGRKESLSWQCAWSNQTWTIINIFPYTYRFCTMSVLKFGWRLMEQLRSESLSYQIALFPRLLMTSSVFVGRCVFDTRRHVDPNFVVKWNKIKLESVFFGLMWLFVKIKQFCMLASPLLTCPHGAIGVGFTKYQNIASTGDFLQNIASTGDFLQRICVIFIFWGKIEYYKQ